MKDAAMMKILTLAVALACTALPFTHALAQQTAPAKAAAKPMAAQKSFDSPQIAVKALIEAVRAADANALLAVVGPGSKSWIFSGDLVADRETWRKFQAAYDTKNSIANEGDAKATLVVGE